MKSGWIKIYRTILDCAIWDNDSPYDERSAWVELLLKANHHDKQIVFNGKLITIKRGQFVTSIRKLALQWNWGRNRVSRYLDKLESLQMIERQSDTNRTLLTLVNYEVFQGDMDEQRDTNEATNETTNKATNEAQTRKKEVKKERNNKYFDSESVNNSFLSFIEMRKKMKSPMTDRAIDLAVKKINELSKGDSATAVKIIDRSVMQGWKGFYPLDDSKKKNDFHDNYMKHNYDYDEMEKILLARD